MSTSMISIRVTDENGSLVANTPTQNSSCRRLVSPPPSKDRVSAANFFLSTKSSSLQPFGQQTNHRPL